MSRRGHGEGTIYQRGPRQWCAMVTIGYDEAGRRKRRAVYGKTQEDVRQKLHKLQHQAASGISIAVHRQTLAEFLDRWLNDVAKLRVKPTTFFTYEWHTRKHIKPRIGGVQLTKLTPLHIQNLYSRMIEEGASPRACQHVHVILHVALEEALRWGLVPRNVCDAVRKPKAPRKAAQALTAEQVTKFLDTAKSDRLHALYVLATTTGLRQGELLGLQWSDVDLKVASLTIRHNLVEIRGKCWLDEPKTAGSRRSVVLTRTAVQALKDHRRRLLAEGHHARQVFCDTEGGFIRKSNLTRRSFKPLLKLAGVPEIPFHNLRHTAATLLLSMGVHPKVVQEMLGHTHISTTMDVYSHVLPSMQKEAAEKMEALLRK